MREIESASAAADSRRVAAIFDLDGTITRKDTYLDFLLRCFERHPLLAARLPALCCAWAAHATRFKDNSWLKETFLGQIVGGATRSELDGWTEEFAQRVMHRGLRAGALRAIEDHRRAGHRLIMATASFDFYVEKLAEKLGFDEVVCTRAAWTQDGTLTGRIAGCNCYGEEKLRRLQERFAGQRHDWYMHGYTDHHSDIAFLGWVDRPVAVNPTRKMLRLAKQSAFEIVVWDR
jgi:phosphatidylglycerophosphatase C